MKVADPEGLKKRFGNRLKKRVYKNPGPNYCWHEDGYDKIKQFGFAIHGCIDGCSRKIIWLEVSNTNNDPKVIASYFLNAIKKLIVYQLFCVLTMAQKMLSLVHFRLVYVITTKII